MAMQVNNTNNFTQLGINKVNSNTAKNVLLGERAQAVTDSSEKSAQKAAVVERLAVSEQAITLFEQQSATNKNVVSNNASLDKPSAQNLTAVNTYQTVNNLAQRESIQSMLGVDLYA